MSYSNKGLHIITVFIILFALAASMGGVFYTDGGEAYNFLNQYGDTVRIYGNGLYAHDSFTMAPVFRGTDFAVLFIAIPALVVALFIDMKRKSIKSRLFLASMISVFTYYATSISFGVTYNQLHLVYIALFSFSLFGLITALGSISRDELKSKAVGKMPYKGFTVFLSLSGVVLIVAWIPGVVASLTSGSSLALIEVYTTSITNVLDMGIIGPAALIGIYQLKKRNAMGYIILGCLLTLCAMIGFMLPMQTIYQLAAGVELPAPVLVTQVSSFVILALFALYFDIRLFRAIRG